LVEPANVQLGVAYPRDFFNEALDEVEHGLGDLTLNGSSMRRLVGCSSISARLAIRACDRSP
jgi:hypothetical protein